MLAAVSYFNLKWPRWELCSFLNPEFFSPLLRTSFSQICPCTSQWYESFQVWRVCLLNWLLKSHCCCRRIFMYSAICKENRNVTALNFWAERRCFILFISHSFLLCLDCCVRKCAWVPLLKKCAWVSLLKNRSASVYNSIFFCLYFSFRVCTRIFF